MEENQTEKYALAGRIIVVSVILLAISFFRSNVFPPFVVSVGLLLLILSSGKIKTSYLNFVLPLTGIFIIGILGVFGHEYRHIFRDITYSLTPISLIYIGFWTGEHKKIVPVFFKIIIIGGIIIAILHLVKFIPNPELLKSRISVIRFAAFNPNVELVGLALVIGIFQKHLKMGNLFPKIVPYYIAIPLLFLSLIFSFSRMGIVLAIIMSLSIMGLIGRINMKTIVIIALFICGFALLIITTPKDESVTFRGKIARSLREVVTAKYNNMKELNMNWRGYETSRAINTFDSGSIKQKILGHGFGSMVDLGITMNLAGTDYKKIPVLHNGYAYILVKTGILGFLLYIFFYFNLFRYSRMYGYSLIQEQVMFSRLLLGCTLSLILAMLVVGGMAEIHNSEYVLLLGLVLCRLTYS